MAKDELINERTVTPREATILIDHAMRRQRATFLWGPPGIGKSDLMEQLAENWDRPSDLHPDEANPNARTVIDMRLLLLDPTDIKGIPYFDSNEGVMKWAPSSELPAIVTQADVAELEGMLVDAEAALASLKLRKDLDEDIRFTRQSEMKQLVDAYRDKAKRYRGAFQLQNAVLFLDEMNSAPPSVQGAAYQLILNRRVGEYHLPDGVSIVAAGNRETDKGVTFRMPTPLRNRFLHLEMVHNVDDWIKWAVNKSIHPDVVGFISASKKSLFNFDPKAAGNAFATPRSWAFVSQLLSDDLPASMNTHLVAGTVGEGVAIEFMQHRKVAAKMPKAEDVLYGRAKKLEIKDVSAKYTLTVNLCYTLKDMSKMKDDTENRYNDKDWNACVDNFFAYIMDNFEAEMIILGAKTALRDYKLPIKHRELKNFKKFYTQYGKYVLE